MKDETKGFFEVVGLALLCAGAILVPVIFDRERTHTERMRKEERLLAMPDSYWEAERAKQEAKAKMHAVDVAAKERLELDSRERAEKALEAKREFEMNAPDGYWYALACKEEAKANAKIAEKKADAEKYSAQARAEALNKMAHDITKAIRDE